MNNPRTILRCRYLKGHSRHLRVLALPSDLSLEILSDVLTDVFGFWDPEIWSFSTPDGSKHCGESFDTTPTSAKGMTVDDEISKHLAAEGDVLIYDFTDIGSTSGRVEIEFLRTDTGEGPECLKASGPKSGRTPGIDAINAILRNGFGGDGDGEEDGEEDGEDGYGEDADGYDPDAEDMDFIEDVKNLFLRKSGRDPVAVHAEGLPWRDPAEDPPPPTAGEIELDDTPVDPARLGVAYALARRIWDLAPWDTLEETSTVVLKLADGRERVLSPMGHLGEYRALAFYPDFATFRAVHELAKCAPHDPLTLLMFRQWQLAFLKTSELLPGEKETIKAAGVRFERGHLPSLASYVPGCMPYTLGGRELADFVEMLGAAVALYSDPEAMAAISAKTEAAAVPVWSRAPGDGGWRLSREPRQAELRFPLDLPPDLLARLRALPVKDRPVSFSETAVPVGRAGERQKLVRILMAVDENTGMAANPRFTDDKDNSAVRVVQPSEILALLAGILLDTPFGYMPSRLATPGFSLPLFLKRLAALHGGATRYDPDAPTDNIEDFQYSIEQVFTR